MQEKVVVIAIDGATWELLKPWAQKGLLPNIKKLLKNGTSAKLITTIPPITGPAWASFATGKNPGDHGCYNFLIPTDSLLSIEPIDTTKIKGKTFYEILEKADKTSILINMPCSFPPRIQKGVILPSFLDADSQKVYPEDLYKRIPEIKNYRVSPDFVKTRVGDGSAAVKDARDWEKDKFIIAQKLFKKFKWDFFFVMFGMSDLIQHKRFKHLLEGGEPENSVFVQGFVDLDKYVGWFLDNLPEKTTFILMSDHGFKPVSMHFHINVWLRKNGYLKDKISRFRTNAAQPLTPKRLIKGKAKGFTSQLIKIISTFLVTHTTLYLFSGQMARFLTRYIPPIERITPPELLNVGYEMDPHNSVAFSIAGNVTGIYINDKNRFKDGIVSKKDYEKIRGKIIKSLKDLKDEQGKKVFKNVYKKEEVYSGDYLLMAPDIIYEESEHILMTTILSSNKEFKPIIHGDGWHDKEGIFVGFGKNIYKGKQIDDISIQDLAPTILHLFGKHIPIEMEGKILFDIFKK